MNIITSYLRKIPTLETPLVMKQQQMDIDTRIQIYWNVYHL